MATYKDGVTVDDATGKVLAVGDKTAQYNTQAQTTNNTSPSLSLADAQAQATQLTSNGLVSPMSLNDIREQQAEQTAASKASAEATFNPQIDRAKVTGAVNTAGVQGSFTGSGRGSAQTVLIAALNNKVDQRVADIENQMKAAIDQGRIDAATTAQSAIDKLNAYKNDLLFKQIDTALNLRNQDQAQQQIDLARKGQAFNQDIQQKGLDLQIAEMTGAFNDGSPTFTAKQALISNELAKAGLTGEYNGQETFDARVARLSNALAERGMAINEAQLKETIRANKASEANAAARLASDNGGIEDNSPSGIVNAAAKRLDALKGTPQFNDLSYNAELLTIAKGMGYQADGTEIDNQIKAQAGDALNKALNALRPGAGNTNVNDANKVATPNNSITNLVSPGGLVNKEAAAKVRTLLFGN